MVYVYVCKRFKVSMEMVSGKDSEWILSLVKFYLKHRRKEMQKLERAEVNPKRRATTCSYDSSADVFKINVVYKDQKGVDQEVKWIIKVTRSDLNENANVLLKHEKFVFSRLVADLVNAIKQKATTFTDKSRISYQDLLLVPEYIYDETTHAADVSRNVLVLDNLEEKRYYPAEQDPLNLAHFRCAIKTMAKFHAACLCYKQMLWQTLSQQSSQAAASKSFEDVEVEGEKKLPVGREGLFARFPFLSEGNVVMNHLLSNRKDLFDMYRQLLMSFPTESYLLDIFDTIIGAADTLLDIEEEKEEKEEGEEQEEEEEVDNDHPLDSIAIGVVEARSFLFCYDDIDNKENKGAKVQRSHSDRTTTRDKHVANKALKNNNSANKDGPAKPKCPKIDVTKGDKSKASSPKTPPTPGPKKVQNKLFQTFVKKSQDDESVPPLQLKKKDSARDPNAIPYRAALVNAKYVMYTRLTKDLAVFLFTSGNTLIRRFYLIKSVETFAETIGISLSNLGIDTDRFKLTWHTFIKEFQTHVIYGFLVGVLVAMANTSVQELNELVKKNGRLQTLDPEFQKSGDADSNIRYCKLTSERIEWLLDMMRDIGSYVESKDFEQNLPITNFARYHELWSMQDE